MILKDIHSECQRCENLKAWNIHMNGEHDYSCRKHPMFISKDLHREPCEKFIAKVMDYVSNNYLIGEKCLHKKKYQKAHGGG